MSKEQLKYIFGKSACLTPRQMKQYTHGQMTNEECHAVEVHLNSCAFCNEAVEGLFEQQEGDAADVAATLNSDFLKDHFSIHHPQVHLNSMAPAQPIVQVAQPKRKRMKVQPFWRPSSIAAVVLLGFGLLWYIKFGQKAVEKVQIAQALPERTEVNNASASAANETQQNQALYNDGIVEKNSAATVTQPPESNLPNQTPPTTQPPVLLADNVEGSDAKASLDSRQDENIQKQAGNEDLSTAAKFVPAAPAADTKDVDVVQAVAANKKTKTLAKMPQNTGTQLSEIEVATAGSRRENGKAEPSADDLYNNGKYSAALNLYKQEMAEAGSRGKRQRAAINVARCHVAMGNKQKARQLLQSIVDEGGPQKRTARKMLENMDSANGAGE
jgi:FimV-like protein